MKLTIDTEQDFEEVAQHLSKLENKDYLTYLAVINKLVEISVLRGWKTNCVCSACGGKNVSMMMADHKKAKLVCECGNYFVVGEIK